MENLEQAAYFLNVVQNVYDINLSSASMIVRTYTHIVHKEYHLCIHILL